jgi:hypothetical protein
MIRETRIDENASEPPAFFISPPKTIVIDVKASVTNIIRRK